LGMHGSVYANYAVSQCDLLIALGVRFDDRVTGKISAFARRATIVHIDLDASEINKVKQAHIPVLSDVRPALAALNRIVQPPENLGPWLERIEAWKQANPLEYDEDCPHILPQHAIAELCRLTRGRDTIIATGV